MNGNTSVNIDGVPENALVDTQKPQDLVEKLKLSLPEGDGLGKDGLLDVVQKILRYSVNTWDQGFMDKLYASNTPVFSRHLLSRSSLTGVGWSCR